MLTLTIVGFLLAGLVLAVAWEIAGEFVTESVRALRAYVIKLWRTTTGLSEEHPPEPTVDQCNARARFRWSAGECMALWYPQMGGYVGKAVVHVTEDGCCDVWVWHDGTFPFSDDPHADRDQPESPALLHHCEPAQFVEFGEACAEFVSSLDRG